MPKGVYIRTKKGIYNKCKVCNKEFYIYKCWFKRNQGKFCSKKCKGKWMVINQRGEKACNWKGGFKIDSHGYVLIYKPNHIFSNSKGYIFEHRLVMEKIIGRYLKSHEVVHHKNFIVNDNRVRNLKLFPSNGEHIKFHNTNVSLSNQ